MNDFTDSKHSIPELVIQGSVERDIHAYSNDDVLELLESWQSRTDPTVASSELFHRHGTQVFTITYQGESDHYWPNEDANQFAEALLRDVLYSDGICKLEGFDPMLYQIKFKVIVMEETEYLLVLPYPTTSGNIGGLVVVCINNYLRI